MKLLDRLILKIFSLIVFVLAGAVLLIMTGILPLNSVVQQLVIWLDQENVLRGIIAIVTILILFAIKGIFFTGKKEDSSKEGIILENVSGKLIISKESLENLIASVVKEINGAEAVSSKTILDRDKNLIVYVTAIVNKDVMIKDVSNELQQKIKEAMKRTADLEVKEVNIRIKNITTKKMKGLPAPENSTNTEEKVEEVSQEENVEEIKED